MITIDPIKRPPKKSCSVDTTEIMKEVDQKFAPKETVSKLSELEVKILELQTLINNHINGTSQVSEWIDLGLPSGLLWASTNVGAEKPEDFGLYFAWGETQGYEGVTIDKQFTWNDYKFVTEDSLTKYNDVDGLTMLELEDDAVYQSDNTCRMPTKAELEELTANTTLTSETLNGVNGGRFTSKTNGNSIFVPAAGYCGDGSVYVVGSGSNLWSSSRGESDPSGAWSLYFDSGSVGMDIGGRYNGLTVRAVQEANVSSEFDPYES